MYEFWNSRGTNHQITIFLGFVGWAIAIWQSIVAFKHKKDSVVFENRLQIYNEYFQNFDSSQNQKLFNVGRDLIKTKNELEILMRKDLGIK